LLLNIKRFLIYSVAFFWIVGVTAGLILGLTVQFSGPTHAELRMEIELKEAARVLHSKTSEFETDKGALEKELKESRRISDQTLTQVLRRVSRSYPELNENWGYWTCVESWCSWNIE